MSETFTEVVIAAMRERGWRIYKIEEHGFEWWWNPEQNPPGTRGGVSGDEGRDWYWPFRDAVGMALFEDEQAKRNFPPLIPKGTGKLICDEKHGEREFETALDVIRVRLEDDYWYHDWLDPRDNPKNDPSMHWETRARAIVADEDEDAALAFLIERRYFEYERFFYEHPEPSPDPTPVDA